RASARAATFASVAVMTPLMAAAGSRHASRRTIVLMVPGRHGAGGLTPAETRVPRPTVTTATAVTPSSRSVTEVASCVAAAVLGRFDAGQRKAPEHVRAHVGEDQAPAAEALPPIDQRPIVQVMRHPLLEEVRLANEQVGVPGRVSQRVRPLGVPGVRDHLPAP